MKVREIIFGTDEFREECELRHRVLRAPLGLNLYDQNLDAEKDQVHFGLFDDNEKLVACVIVIALSTTQAKLRQMAVAPEQQRRGRGRKLIQNVESTLLARGVTTLSLHARKTAVGFYEGLGYVTYGETFIEVGLPHMAMRKLLTER
jgi:hypothetical protein